MNKDQRILLTVLTEKGFHSRVEGVGFDKKRPKMSYETKDGMFIGRIPSQRDYVTHSKSRVRISEISANVVTYFQSNESKPQKRCNERDNWSKMSGKQRLEYHLSQNAEGKEFEYSFF